MAADTLINDFELPFQLYEVLDCEALCEHEYFAEHNKQTFNAVLDTANKMACELFLPHNHLADANEPIFDGKKVSMINEVKIAFDAFRQSGFIAGRYEFEEGGMQLPESIMTALSGYFMAANPSTTAYPFLTSAAVNLIKHFASDKLKQAFVPRMLSGDFTGTMALTEPHAGSSLADIKTSAIPNDDGSYRIKGSKIYISGGDHELSENIVHLVLAKIPGGPEGVKGISLFMVPKYRLNDDMSVGAANDVQLAGLLHKLGYRGTTSTVLSFGEKGECYGYLVGQAHFGLRYMFMMMNEARIAVGFGAAMIAYRGYQYSLQYAKERPQGRSAFVKSDNNKQTFIINHGDVKRMLLAQKAYSEGGIALCLYGSNLLDRIKTSTNKQKADDLRELLDLLTPVLKAWPSEYGLKANDFGIQVLGGAGYTREYFAEQFWRDNRLNPIHEGTNGIQALDLSFRKLWQNKAKGLEILQKEMARDFANIKSPKSQALLKLLLPYIDKLTQIINVVSGHLVGEEAKNLSANAQAMMNVFSTIVVSWTWLKQASKAEQLLALETSEDKKHYYLGKIQAASYYIHWELPSVDRDVQILLNNDDVCANMQTQWF